MSQYPGDEAKKVVEDVLNDARCALPAADFLSRVIAKGYQQDQVVAAVREMLDAGDIRFDADMRIGLTKELA